MEINRAQFKNKHENFGMKVSEADEPEKDNRPVSLHVAIDSATYSSSGITKGWQKAGYRVCQMNWQQIKMNEGVMGLQDRLIQKATEEKPEIIFLHIQNPDILDPYTCDTLTSICKTILYNFDCRDKERSQWMYDLAPHLSLLAFSNQEDVNNCKELGYSNSFVLQSAADLDLYNTHDMRLNMPVPPVVFIGGNYYSSNMGFPNSLERQVIIMALMGNFKNLFTSYGIGQKENRYIHQAEEAAIYNQCQIAINHNNFDREGYTSDRLWRIISSGAFCLTKYFKGIEDIFKRGVHLDWWHNEGELRDKVEYYLRYPEERKGIARMGCQYVREHHSWYNRVETVLQQLKELSK